MTETEAEVFRDWRPIPGQPAVVMGADGHRCAVLVTAVANGLVWCLFAGAARSIPIPQSAVERL